MTHWSKLLLITDEVTVVVLQFWKNKTKNYSIESSKAAQNDPDSHQHLYLFIFLHRHPCFYLSTEYWQYICHLRKACFYFERQKAEVCLTAWRRSLLSTAASSASSPCSSSGAPDQHHPTPSTPQPGERNRQPGEHGRRPGHHQHLHLAPHPAQRGARLLQGGRDPLRPEPHHQAADRLQVQDRGGDEARNRGGHVREIQR